MKFILAALALSLAFGCMANPPGGVSISPSGRTEQRFDTDWRFYLGDVPGAQSSALNDSSWRHPQLPHDWSIEQPFSPDLASGTGFLPGGIGWYRKTFTLDSRLAGRRISVRFDGIYMNSHVWINGHDLGLRPNGFVSFQYDLTAFLNPPGQPNVLAVRVDHANSADSRFYTGSGIYRDVWLISTGDVHVIPWGVYVTTPNVAADSAMIGMQTSLANESEQSVLVTVDSQIDDAAGNVVAAAQSDQTLAAGQAANLDQQANLAHPTLWSCDQPYLYRLITTVRVAGQIVDQLNTPFGVRSIDFNPDRGFLLNGQKTLIKGVCLHQDAGALGAAVTEDVFARRLQLLKQMGCNAIRTSHNPPSPLLLDLCDRMGFLVMDEAFDEWARPKKKWVTGRNNGSPSFQGYSEYFNRWAVRDLQSMVQRDRNHPSVILWSIGNEIDYDKDPYWDPQSPAYQPNEPSAAELPPIAKALKDAVKQVDQTRPVTAALATIAVSNETGLADVLDVVGYNYQEQHYPADHARFPHRAMFGSENFHFYPAWKAVEDLPYASGQFLWTGFDYLGESARWPLHGSPAGDLDECGFAKPLYYFRQSLWTDKPMVYLAVQQSRLRSATAWTAPDFGRSTATVLCYTNCQQVELLLNGKSLGTKRLADSPGHVLTWQVHYTPGTLHAVGDSGCVCDLTTPGRPDHIRLISDKSVMVADGRSLAFIEADVVDNANHLGFAAEDLIHFTLTGPATIAAVDSGDLISQESFQSDSRHAFHGQCLLIVRSGLQSGNVSIQASSTGLASGETTISTSN
jgi:beta-galactosidase